MKKKPHFGELTAETFSIGDIVEWSTYSNNEEVWLISYGIIASIDNKFRSNRLVSVSTVIPINGPREEIEFFTASLKLVSKTTNENENE
tara:strand:+ start:541 stop:807 length:267 start_codon:yes stop_codon:yes gene_type:complete